MVYRMLFCWLVRSAVLLVDQIKVFLYSTWCIGCCSVGCSDQLFCWLIRSAVLLVDQISCSVGCSDQLFCWLIRSAVLLVDHITIVLFVDQIKVSLYIVTWCIYRVLFCWLIGSVAVWVDRTSCSVCCSDQLFA